MDDLEFARLSLELPFAAVRALIDMGVPAAVVGELCARGDLAVAGIELSASASRFALGGATRRLLLAIRDADGELLDVVAMSSTCEDEWALWRGAVDLLGEDVLGDAIMAERREVRLFATPMAWLRAPGAGICVLDWNRTALGALRGLRPWQTLVVDPGAKPKLDALLAYGGLPMVAEDRSAMRRAA